MIDDTISRQWLMECVNEGWIKFDTEKDENRFMHLVRDIAPTAERKKGHCISLDDFRGRYNDYGYKCSECGEPCDYEENFCPNCGAEMIGDNNGGPN